MTENPHFTVGEFHDLEEANAEIARHHRDFERISEICDGVERHYFGSGNGPVGALLALREIRNIVG